MNSPSSSRKPLGSRLLWRALLGGLWVFGAASCGDPPEFSLRPGMNADSVFTADVIPLLREECGACHYPGGEVYATMPFDEVSVLLRLEGEVLVRTEGEARSRLESWYRWLATEERARFRAPGASGRSSGPSRAGAGD